MAAAYPYMNSSKRLLEILGALREAGQPPRVTHDFLGKAGFKSKNDRPVVNLLKFLGLLDSQGTPTALYARFRGDEYSDVLSACIRDSYSELLDVRPHASTEDVPTLAGFFKTASGLGEAASRQMASTFLALCSQADLQSLPPTQSTTTEQASASRTSTTSQTTSQTTPPSVNITINLHLPDDPDGYEAIFEALYRQLLR